MTATKPLRVTSKPADHKVYTRLQVARDDIELARQCAGHLLKKGWHKHLAYHRRATSYFHQSVYTTTLVIAYARPFTKGRGLKDLLTLCEELLAPYSNAEWFVHAELLELRDRLYAHSDAKHHDRNPTRRMFVDRKREFWVGEAEWIPSMNLTADDLTDFLIMTAKILPEIHARISALEEANKVWG